jgi:hypothetical protein
MKRSPDDAEDIEFEMNAELDRDEQRAIDRRAEWYAQQRRERGWT